MTGHVGFSDKCLQRTMFRDSSLLVAACECDSANGYQVAIEVDSAKGATAQVDVDMASGAIASCEHDSAAGCQASIEVDWAADARKVLEFYCINLRSNAKRLDLQREQACQHALDVIPVVACVPHDATYNAAIELHAKRMMRGETRWRCPAANAIILSWLNAVRRASRSTSAVVLIGEDDVVFPPDFRTRLDHLKGQDCFLHALGMPYSLSERDGMQFEAPPTGWGPGHVFESWPVYKSQPSCRVMAGNPAMVLIKPPTAARLGVILETALATEMWNPIDQLFADLADEVPLRLAADPGLCWELCRERPTAAAAASDREAHDQLSKKAVTTKRRFKWGREHGKG